jgi:predicted transcriptional regulator
MVAPVESPTPMPTVELGFAIARPIVVRRYEIDGVRLRYARQCARLSLAELGVLAGVSGQRLQQIECAGGAINEDLWERILAALLARRVRPVDSEPNRG